MGLVNRRHPRWVCIGPRFMCASLGNSYPYPHGPFEYFSRTVEGLSYRIHCRRPRGDAGFEREEVVLDENKVGSPWARLHRLPQRLMRPVLLFFSAGEGAG